MKFKKNLGQNFLKDENVLKKIIQTADLSAKDNIVEIGPGEGILTQELVKYAGKIIIIEKDDRLALKLNSLFSKNDTVKIIHDDILKINLPKLISSFRKSSSTLKAEPLKYKVIANIPYYITSPIIRLFLETKHPPQEMILMVQKEVAERIIALPRKISNKNQLKKSDLQGKPGQMSILAVSVQYYAKPELLFYVDKKSFFPEPKVNSAVIRITPFNPIPKHSSVFFRVVRAGFASKRKTLLNNLSHSLHLPKINVEKQLKKIGINPAQRAQELSVDDWKKISRL